jgi:putative transposase
MSFWQCSDGKMILSDAGNIALHYWNEIPKHFPFVELAAFVIMPNHVHGIIIIDKPATESDIANAEITDRTKQTTVASVKWETLTAVFTYDLH